MTENHGQFAGFENRHTGASDYLFTALRNEFRDLVPDDRHYESLFDQYELLVALAYLVPGDPAQSRPMPGDRVWAPVGRFVWRRDSDFSGRAIWDRLRQDVVSLGDHWPPVSAGMFRGNSEVARDIIDAATPFFVDVARRLF